MRFDRVARQWVPRIVHSYASTALAVSSENPDIIYEGEEIDALVGIISRSQGDRIGSLLDIAPLNTYINAIVPAPGDDPVYVAYGEFGGVWAVDPVRDTVIARISLATLGDTTYLGQASGMAPSPDGAKVYVAVTDGSPRGVAEIDVATNRISRRLALSGARPNTLAVSPDGQRAFVTTQDLQLNVPSSNVLIDLTTWQPLEFVPRPRPPGDTRWDQGVVFHPNGKLIFVAHNQNVDVYLMRQ
jgi:dipeptidyl aminopeptidase/acylaminoacyl peptidase